MPGETGSGAIRVFISSTFRDMAAERDHLMRVVFPELEQRCMARGLPFIAVDLRWGVTQAEAESGAALEICLDEIERCRPFFVCLLGERYGWLPLPRVVAKSFADRLDPEAARPFHEAYVENVGYDEYVARPDADNEPALLRALEEVGVPNAGASITAQEIYHGVLSHPGERMHSLFHFRDAALTEALAGGDPDDFYEATDEGRRKLAELKADIQRAGIAPHSYASVEALGDLVLDQLWERIVREHPEERPAPRDPLAEERQAQDLFVQRLTTFFVGRDDMLAELDRLVTQSPSGYLAVTGPSGCGKTALLANWLYGRDGFVSRHPEIFTLSHFIGASGRSANAREILTRFCQELAPIAERTDPLPGEFSELSAALRQILEAAAQRRPILLVLDALDQLESADNAQSLSWLPGTLPDNVLIVASSLSGEEYRTWQPLQSRAGDRVLNVPLLEKPSAERMIADFLALYRKHLSPEQLAAFADKPDLGSPLYLQVALNELLAFGEFERVTEYLLQLPGTIPAIYEFVLEHLEREYDRPFVARVMSCLACGRYGMTEQELLALAETSVDLSHPSSGGTGAGGEGIAPLKWARLYRILAPHLLHRGEVLAFYHRQLQEAVGRRYLQDADSTRQTHADIARYFAQQPVTNRRKLEELPWQQLTSEHWAGLAATLSDYEFVEASAAADRVFPLLDDYHSAEAAIPAAALPDEGHEELAEWHDFVKASARRLRQAQEPFFQTAYNWATSRWVAESAARRAPRQGTWLKRLNRAQYRGRTSSRVSMVCEGAASVAIMPDGRRCLAARYSDLCEFDLVSGARLREFKGHTSPIKGVVITPDGQCAVTGAWDRTLRVWDLRSGVCLRTMTGHTAGVNAVALSSDGRLVVSGALRDGGGVRVWDLGSGACLRVLGEESKADTADVALSPDDRLIVAVGLTSLRIWDLETGSLVRSSDQGGQTVAVAPNGSLAIVGRLLTLNLEDIQTGEVVQQIPIRGSASDIAVSPDGQRLLVASASTELLVFDYGQSVWRRLFGHTDSLAAVAVSADGHTAVSAGRDGRLRAWDLERPDDLPQLAGHGKPVPRVGFTSDGKGAIALGDWGRLSVWDMQTGDIVWGEGTGSESLLPGPALVPRRSRVVLGAINNRDPQVWDLAARKRLHALPGHDSTVQHAEITPDGRRAVTTSHVQGTDVGTPLFVWDLATGERVGVLEGHGYAVRSLFLTPEGRRALSSDGHEIRLWDLEALRCLRVTATTAVPVALLPDGTRAMVGTPEGRTTLWLLEAGKVAPGGIQADDIYGTAVAPDGTWAVAVDATGAVLTWNLVTNETEVLAAEGASSRGTVITNDQRHVVFGRDAPFSAAASVLEVLHLADRTVAPYLCDAQLWVWAASADARHLVVGDTQGGVYLLELSGRETGPPILTASRLWQFGTGAPPAGSTQPGHWDASLSAECPFHGERSAVGPAMLGEVVPCPECGHDLRLNPFACDPSAWMDEP